MSIESRGGRYVVRWYDAEGVRQSRSFTLKKDADRFDLDVRRRLELGDLYRDDATRYGAILDGWFKRWETGVGGKRKPVGKTVAGKQALLAHLDPLRDVEVRSLTLHRVEELLAELAAVKPRTAEQVASIVRASAQYAANGNHRVPPGLLTVRVGKAQAKDGVFLTWPQVQAFAQAFACDTSRRIILFAARTGLRWSEITLLEDTDVDFKQNTVTVRRSATKTDAGRRTVPFGPYVRTLLVEQYIARPGGVGLVFPNPAGKQWEKGYFRRFRFEAAKTFHGADPNLTFHHLRHTFASLLVAAGVHPRDAADLMGHSDGGALFLRTYGHLYQDSTRRAMDRLDEHLLGTAKRAKGGVTA